MKKQISLLKKVMVIGCVGLLGMTSFAMADDSEVVNADVGYVNKKNLPTDSSQINPIRLQALRETATTLGARGALAWRAKQIDHSLKQEARHLDHVFDFGQLMLPHNVVPPVLSEADNSINASNDMALRLASKTYTIVTNAHFATAPPSWRTYLWMDYSKPDMPDKTLLPNTQAEAQVWNYYLKQGWTQGLQQANAIFNVQLSTLKRDYSGMVLYRKLYAEHMVTAPFVAGSNLGVTGDANHIRINDRVLRITAVSSLQTDSKKWKPIVVK